MGIFESITHKEEIENLLNEAQEKYDSAKNTFESQKKRTAKSLERLGKTKINVWAKGMDAFISDFRAFKDIEYSNCLFTNTRFIGSNETPQQMLVDMQSVSMSAKEIAATGVASVGTGALVGVASYGGVSLLGSASTGTAISNLHGVAKKNATLAWFGGGSLETGGRGMAGGKVVLAGLVLAPIVGMAALITNSKSKQKLEEAKKIHSQAMKATADLDKITACMKAVEEMSNKYNTYIKRFNKKFQPFVCEVNRIRTLHQTNDNKIEIDTLTSNEQRALNLAWRMARIFWQILSAPILTESGEVSPMASQTMLISKSQFNQIRKETFKLSESESNIGDLVWSVSAKKVLMTNIIVSILFVMFGFVAISDSILRGILCIVAGIVAFPIFFKFKDMPQSRVFMWRIVRAVLGLVLFILALIVE